MATVDEELDQIERDIRTLKIEYEQFFGGGRKRPPIDTQWRVESLLRRYNERTAELSYSQRFRFTNLAQTYAKYQDMWRKKVMQKEGGVTHRHFGAAARHVEAERQRQATEKSAATGNSPASTAQETTAKRDGQASDAASTGLPRGSFAVSVPDALQQKDKVKVQELYQKLISARVETGEKAGTPSLRDFERFVEQKTKELADKGGQEIEYSVSIESGRVKLKARISG